jgi:chromosome partitioning protein
MKGGVGKTTVVVSLAETLAAGVREGADSVGSKVLVIDLDAQANASFCLAGDDILLDLIVGGQTIDAFMEDRVVFSRPRNLSDLVRSQVGAIAPDAKEGRLSLIAASPELRIIEREIVVYLSRQDHDLRWIESHVGGLLREQIATLRNEYDYILFDCAPGISILTEAALRVSDVVVVPTVPDFISNLGLEAFCKSVRISESESGGGGKTPWVLANRVRRTPLQLKILEEMRNEAAAGDAGFRMFRTEIPDQLEMADVTAWQGERQPYLTKYGREMIGVLNQVVGEF